MRRFDEITPGRIKHFSGTAKACRRALPFIKKTFFVEKSKGCICGEKTAIVGRIHASFEGRHAEEIRSFAERTHAALPFFTNGCDCAAVSFWKEKTARFLEILRR